MVNLGLDLERALNPVAFAQDATLSELDAWQEEVLRSPAKRIILNCSRQAGKSTIGAVKAMHLALYKPRSLILILAPALRQSLEAFGKVLAAYRDTGRPVPPESERKLSLELENGSRIVSLPGTERTVRGFSGASLLIIDEAARVEEALIHAVRPMLAVSGGALMMLSTPHGRRGTFFEEWTKGAGWERYEVPATEVGRISAGFLEEERGALPERIYRQEYLCSFEDVEDAVFSSEVIASAFSDEFEPLDLGAGRQQDPEPRKEEAPKKPARRFAIRPAGEGAPARVPGDGGSYWEGV